MQGTIEKQANSYIQGTRTVYNFTMTFQEVEENLRRRLPEDFAQMLETNRAMDPKRVSALEKYLTDTPDWVLQPLTLAASASATDFSPNGTDPGCGHLTLNHDDDTPIRIIDGQHRRQAIHQLIDKEQAAVAATQAQNWRGQEIAVTLFIEDASKKLRQMFADIAEAKPIDRATRTRFNTSDPFNNIAQSVEADSQLLRTRIDTAKTTTQIARSEYLMTGSELKDIVSILLTAKTMNKPTGQMALEFSTPQKEEESIELCISFLDSFLPNVHDDLSNIFKGELSPTELSIKRQNNLLLYPQVVMFLAHCYGPTDGDAQGVAALTAYISDQDFEKNPHVLPDGDGFLKAANLVNIERTNAGKVTLLGKTRPEWGIAARDALKNARAAADPQD